MPALSQSRPLAVAPPPAAAQTSLGDFTEKTIFVVDDDVRLSNLIGNVVGREEINSRNDAVPNNLIAASDDG